MEFAFRSFFHKCFRIKYPVNKTSRNAVRPVHMLQEGTDFPEGSLVKVNETVIANKLKECSIPFSNGYTCFHVNNCSFCPNLKTKEPENSEKSDIFINKKTGFFVCDRCRISGNWTVFNSLLKKCQDNSLVNNLDVVKEKCVKLDIPTESWNEIVNKTTLLCNLKNDMYDNVFEFFKLPHCSKKVIEKFNIRINNAQNLMYFPLACSGRNVVGYKTLDIHGNTSTWPRNDCPGFLLWPNSKKPVVLVEQVSDFFALLSVKVPAQVICLPYKSNSLPQTLLPYLESYDKLILWLGGPSAMDACGVYAKKLNEKRCYVVKPTEKQKTALKAYASGENMSKILSEAKPTWHQFVTTFNTFREEVLAELQNKEKVAGVTWKRFQGLNKILKGHRRGELTVLTGPTGSGKTTFASEYSLDLAMQGVNTLWGSFEIKNSRLLKLMLQQFAGVSLERNVQDFDRWADEFEKLPLYFMTFHGQHTLSKVIDTVEHCSYAYDIAHVVIDNVQFMIDVSNDSMGMDRFWKQDCIIQAFRHFATQSNCHVTLVMHPRKEVYGSDLGISSVFGGAKATQEADNVFIIQSRRMPSGDGKSFLEVCKNRYSGDLGFIPLVFDKSSFSFSTHLNYSREQYQRASERYDRDVDAMRESEKEEMNLTSSSSYPLEKSFECLK